VDITKDVVLKNASPTIVPKSTRRQEKSA